MVSPHKVQNLLLQLVWRQMLRFCVCSCTKQKLAVPRVPYLRKAQEQELPEEATERFSQALCEAFATGARPVLATDGGSTGKTVWDRCGGWGAATGVTQVSGQLMGLDHTAYAAELRAALTALVAIAKA